MLLKIFLSKCLLVCGCACLCASAFRIVVLQEGKTRFIPYYLPVMKYQHFFFFFELVSKATGRHQLKRIIPTIWLAAFVPTPISSSPSILKCSFEEFCDSFKKDKNKPHKQFATSAELPFSRSSVALRQKFFIKKIS